MSIIHHTTMVPTKLDLLTEWLPTRAWYTGTGRTPELAKIGGFRLDDPEGAVGIEFMAVTDTSGDGPRTYHVPMTYRAAPLDGAEDALIGTSEHGVLGERWIYDGTRDPVLIERLCALLLGRAEPQMQSVSDTPDPAVARSFARETAALIPAEVSDGPGGTEIRADADGPVTVRVNRVLRPGDDEDEAVLGAVTAGWRGPDGEEVRGRYVAVLPGPAD